MVIPSHIHLAISEQGEPYLNIRISDQEVAPYLEQMRQVLNKTDFHTYVLNQQLRDEYRYHMTLISPIECKAASKQETYQAIEGSLVYYNLVGLGRVFKREEEVFFVVAESLEMDNLRKQVGLPKRDFHVTLGFKNGDIHDVIKNRTTLIK